MQDTFMYSLQSTSSCIYLYNVFISCVVDFEADLTAICEPIVYKNVGASTSHNPMGLHGLLQG
jgi:hypothetical protein